jgi:ATP-dependent RNA helicase DeaD
MVLVPTRELAMQVAEAVHRYGRGLGARVLPVYGGAPIGRQARTLERGVDVVVATPGRALDLLARGVLRLGNVRVVVLDEADEMLDMGFAEDIEQLLAAAPTARQTVLFSATMPRRVTGMVDAHLRRPFRVSIAADVPTAGEAPRVRQTAYLVPRAHKVAALTRVLDLEAPTAALVFCRTREEVDSLSEVLSARGYRADALHGGMSQEQRDRVMGRLRSGASELLVATDVAARGLDVEHLTHVVNFGLPSAPESYVHRIGRVGRAGREGVAVTVAEPREHRMLRIVGRTTGQRIDVAAVPSVADLRARRLELLREALADSAASDELDRYRVVVESLADEHDVMTVALAALRLADLERTGEEPGEHEEIPSVTPGEAARQRPTSTGRPPRAGGSPRDGRPTREWSPGREDRPERRGRPQGASGPAAGNARVYVGVGRSAGVRPADLVGAITGESGLRGRDVGAIEIFDRFSLVEVPAASVDVVVDGLRGTTIRGRRPLVRPDRGASPRRREE